MRLRNIPGSREAIAESPFTLETPTENKGRWRELYPTPGEVNPGQPQTDPDRNKAASGSWELYPGHRELHIEIGMGKGRFIMELARRNPDILYIGIEKYSSVLLRGLQKITADPLSNICFIRMEAEEITSVFDNGEVDKIYLNFSDPWPKDRHAKRRLPSGEFLKRYDQILSREGSIEFKTDNRDLFDFAVEEAKASVFEIGLITYDLHSDAALMENNVMTEYEEKFSSQGNPIYKLVLTR